MRQEKDTLENVLAIKAHEVRKTLGQDIAK
jgi:hypothetical protein